MASVPDRRAVIVLLGVALAGTVVRYVAGPARAPGSLAFRFGRPDSLLPDSLAAAAARAGRPLAPGETVDVDRAGAGELTRLPRIGPGLAARIVADREARGPFGTPDALSRVPGIGPATLEGLRPFVRASGRARAARAGEAGEERVAVNRASVEELEALPGVGPALARAIVEERNRNGPFRNAADLARVRGIGPVLVSRLTTRIRIP